MTDINSIDQLAVWQTIVGYVDVKQRFRNPRRADSSPGAILKWTGHRLRLFDPSDELHNKDCFYALQYVHNITFKEALVKAKEIQPNFIPTYSSRTKTPYIIKFKSRKWASRDAPFWNVCGITAKQLLSEKCKPVQKYWTTYKDRWIKHEPTDVYANVINNRCKLYGPKTRLFLTNFIASDIGGFEPMKPDVPFIMTMNLKSYLCLINIGFNSRFVPSESSTNLGGYHPDYYLMDNDTAGINYSDRLVKKHGGKAIRFDLQGTYIDAYGNEKKLSDPYDIAFKYGAKELKRQLNRIL